MIEIIEEGYNDGVNDAYYDFENETLIYFKITEELLLSKLYDLCYMYGYQTTFNLLTKNNT